MSAGREQWIDSARGIGMVVVVGAHNPGLWREYPALGQLLMSFCMPAFFAIAGATMTGRAGLHSTLRRAAGLLISYAVMCLLSLPLAIRRPDHESLVHTLLGIAYGTGHTIVMVPLWFLPSLAVALLLVLAIDAATARIAPRLSLRTEALSAAAAFGLGLAVLAAMGPLALTPRLAWGDLAHSGAPLSLDLAGFGAGFVFIGRGVRRLIDGQPEHARRHLPAAVGATVLLMLLYLALRPRINMNLREFQPAVPALLIAAAACVAALFVVFLLRHTLLGMLSAKLGTMTLVILWLHAGIEKRAWETLAGTVPVWLAVCGSIAVGVLAPYGVDRLLALAPRLRMFIYPQPLLARLRLKKGAGAQQQPAT
ncbi:MAG TPA: acyltransferase family protein [Burkholderiaceae bacterium]|nr:acyltransferase family protein [Burkholderiaceae bacterium]